jgi:hypothetical protein
VRIYLPDDILDTPVVICSELPHNSGGPITNSAEVIAAEVIRANELPTSSYGLLQLRGRGASVLSRGDEGQDMGSYLEEAPPPHRGSLGGM